MIDIKHDTSTAMELLYRGKQLYDIPFNTDLVSEYNQSAVELNLNEISDISHWSKQFAIPPHYRELNVEEYVRNLVPSAEDQTDKLAYLDRVEQELDLFRTRNLYPVLQCLIYIIDTMRKYNLVWGVGRGSSVASYVLYLIGVHKIDSIKYNLDIREFLK